MRLVIQRVQEASVKVDGLVVGEIGQGALVLVGIHKDDIPAQASWLASKFINLRMFSDSERKMNLSLLDIKGSVLIISQFTLYGNCSSGRRPDFLEAAHPTKAKELYEKFIEEVRKELPSIATGSFGADMKVSLINDGPVTFVIDSKS